MAFPQVATSASSTETSDTTSHTISLPASIASGDLLVAVITVDASPSVTFTGWTKFGDTDDIQDGTNQAGTMWWKDATGSEGSTDSFTTSAAQESAHCCYRITGAADPSVDPPTITIASEIINSTTHNPPSHTPGGGAKDYMWIAGVCSDSATTASSYPTNYDSNQVTIAGPNTPGSAGTSVATDEVNAASENPAAYTMSRIDSGFPFTVAVWPSTVSESLIDLSAIGQAANTMVLKQIHELTGSVV